MERIIHECVDGGRRTTLDVEFSCMRTFWDCVRLQFCGFGDQPQSDDWYETALGGAGRRMTLYFARIVWTTLRQRNISAQQKLTGAHMGIDAIAWNIGLGIVASAAWEAIKYIFGWFATHTANRNELKTRLMPFVRNAIIFSVIFFIVTFVVAMYSPLYMQV